MCQEIRVYKKIAGGTRMLTRSEDLKQVITKSNMFLLTQAVIMPDLLHSHTLGPADANQFYGF
jgi:hypothetical protein